ncbi:hypothetical protein HB770_26320 (plasmid) [Rhizobium leguminosarum bv. viciae]|uniref:Uncharacterized protein n=1 Tax=Rhizobium leguminosarum bv. viciae TaxID=387 RepID=A0A7G6RM59_RHILV|nr:hypothetical protein HB770_26320 [Rhizobium leguminosarum bv. viciae]
MHRRSHRAAARRTRECRSCRAPRQIESELELALAEREIIEAEQDGRIDVEPPF